MRHSLLLCVLAIDRVFAQLAALADFNGTLQRSQGEVTYRCVQRTLHAADFLLPSMRCERQIDFYVAGE